MGSEQRDAPSTGSGSTAAPGPGTVVDEVSIPIVAVEGTTVVFANDAIERALGHAPAAVVGERVDRFLPPAFTSRLADFLDRQPDGDGDAFEWAGRATDADGESVPVTVTVRRSGDGADRATAAVVVDADRASAAAGDRDDVSIRNFGGLVTALDSHAFALLDADGTVLSWQSGPGDVTGPSAGEIVGRSLSAVTLDGVDRESVDVERALATVADGGRFESRGWLDPPGEAAFWGSMAVAPVPDAAGAARYGAVITDLTDRMRAVEERQLLVEVSRSVTRAETFAEGVRRALAAVCERAQWVYAEAWAPPAVDAPAGPDVDPADGESIALERVASHVAAPSLDEFGSASEDWTFAPGEGLPGRVWSSGESEWIPHTGDASETVFNRTELAVSADLGAALGVPIVADGAAVAVMTFFLRERRPVDDRLAEIVSSVAAQLGTLVAHKRDEERLERERALLDRVFATSPVGLVLLSADGTVARANGKALDILGLDAAAVTDRPLSALPIAVADPTGEPVEADSLPPLRALETGERIDDPDYRIENADGRTVWASVSAAPIRDETGRVEEVVGVFEDTTRLNEQAQSLRSFKEAIEQAGHSIYVTDVDGAIEYVNPAFEEITGYDSAEAVGGRSSMLSSGVHDDAFYADLWDTILSGEVWTGEVINERKSGERYVVNQTIAPVTDETGEIDRFVAVNTDVTERKRRQRQLRRQRDRLERHHGMLATMWDVTQALVTASTEAELRRSVCEALVAGEFCDVAWIGVYDQPNETLLPVAAAGIDDEHLSYVSLADDAADPAPRRDAVAERRVAVSRHGDDRDLVVPWRETDLERGYLAEAAIPLVHDEVLYGVLNLYSNRPRAFDEDEHDNLVELGDAVAHGLETVKTRKLLLTDQVLELTYRTCDERSFFVEACSAADCRLRLTGTVPLPDDEVLLYVTVEGGSVETFRDLAAEYDGVDVQRIYDAEDEDAVRVTVATQSSASITKRFLDCGARVVEATCADGEATVVVHLAPDQDVRTVTEAVQSTFPDIELVGRHEVERTPDPDRAALADLSDRQLAALYAAYYAGYFRWPRESTAEEVAAELGVSGPTFHKHVRHAEQRLLTSLLEAAEPAE